MGHELGLLLAAATRADEFPEFGVPDELEAVLGFVFAGLG
jgi:hypothetical protein